MAGLKTMHDVRSLRSVAARATPASEGAVFLQLHRLATEKLRLEREAEQWLRKKERLEKRLSEIEGQMEHLRQACPPGIAVESRLNSPRKAWRPVTLEY